MLRQGRGTGLHHLRGRDPCRDHIRSPGYYDPEDHLDRLEARWQYVVDGMVEEGWLPAEEAAGLEFVPPKKARPSATYGGTRGYLIQSVKTELEVLGFDEDEINRGGLRVVSTFDRKVQRAAVTAVEAERPTKACTWGSRPSTASATGAVVAMYGGMRAKRAGRSVLPKYAAESVDQTNVSNDNCRPSIM